MSETGRPQYIFRTTPEHPVDNLLCEGVLSAQIDNDFEGGLAEGHPFSWQSFERDPKGDHGELETRGTWFKSMLYETLHTGGFLRLCTQRGRVYWNAQNEHSHTTPDWKLHLSMEVKDIPVAWNVIAALFMEMKCEIGMKATLCDTDTWPERQRGREMTVYIYKYDSNYKKYMQGVFPQLDHLLYIENEAFAAYDDTFWFTFITESERRLNLAGVQSRGCADGDLPLPGCKYTSLRNEAFILQNGEYVYPPNDVGHNALRHINPLLKVIFFLRALDSRRQ